MSYSSLVSYVKLSPNCTRPRNHVIDTISIHCMAGNLTIETCGAGFANPNRQASSNYGIGSDGRIACYVDENNRSWCTGNKANDHRAITIEVANTVASHPWPISNAAYKSLVNLLVDICKRNPRIGRLRWQANKALIGQVSKQNMTVHRWFQNKACPGDYLYNLHGQIAQEVNSRLDGTSKPAYTVSDSKGTGTVTADTLNVRSGPSTGYGIIGSISGGSTVSITGKSGGWFRIAFKGGPGFVSSSYIKLITQTSNEEDDDVVRYKTLKDIPEGSNFRAIIKDIMAAKIMVGSGGSGDTATIDISHDMLRMFIFNYRAGCYDEALQKAGLTRRYS